MGRDEQREIRKETYYQIYEKEKEIACLEKRLSDLMDQLAALPGAWERDNLSVGQDGSTGNWLPHIGSKPVKLPDTDEVGQCIHDLDEARKQLDVLKRQFERM